MSSGAENSTMSAFQWQWRAPVAVLDRLPDGGGTARDRLADYYTPLQYSPLDIGQEALVVMNGGESVIKFFPTLDNKIYDRLLMLQESAVEFRESLGQIAVDTTTKPDWTPDHKPLKRVASERVIVQEQPHIVHNGNVFDVIDRYTPKNHEGLAEDINTLVTVCRKGVAASVGDLDDSYPKYLPDIQGRGTNLVVAEDDNGDMRLRLLDMSGFSIFGDIHPLTNKEAATTLKKSARLQDWLHVD